MADQDDPPEAPDSPDAPGSRPGARSDPEADGGSGIRPASPPTARRDLRWLVGLDIDTLFLAPGRPGLPQEASSQEAGLAEAVAAYRRAAAPRPPGPESPAPASPGAPPPPGSDGTPADTLPTGPALAAWLADQDPAAVSDHDVVAMASAYRRVASWAQAGELAAVAQIAARSAARDPRAGLAAGGRPAGLTRDAAAQVSLELVLSRTGAEAWSELALDLAWRLPGTAAALAAGRIDLVRAKIVAEAVAPLSDDAAAAVEARVLAQAGDWTYAQLRAAARRAVIAADPDGAEQRRQDAELRAKVSLYPDQDCTATLSGTRLPAAQAASAMARISALARALKAAGAGGGQDLLRAQVFLGLLLGTLPLIPPPAGGPPDADPSEDGPDDVGPGGGGPDGGGPDQAGPDGGGPDQAGPDEGGPDQAGPDEGGPDQAGPDEGGSDRGSPDDAAMGEDSPAEGGPDESGPPQGHGDRVPSTEPPASRRNADRMPDADHGDNGLPRTDRDRSHPPGQGRGDGGPDAGSENRGRQGGFPGRTDPADCLDDADPPGSDVPPAGPWTDAPPLTDADLPADDGQNDTSRPGPDFLNREPSADSDIIWPWPGAPASVGPGPGAPGQAVPDRPGPAPPGPGSPEQVSDHDDPLWGPDPGPAGRGRPPPGGQIDLTLPWATLTGASQAPGTLGRIGPITAVQARALARMATINHATQWRVILTDHDGVAIAVARIPRRRRGALPGLSRPPDEPLAGWLRTDAIPDGPAPTISRVTVIMPAAALDDVPSRGHSPVTTEIAVSADPPVSAPASGAPFPGLPFPDLTVPGPASPAVPAELVDPCTRIIAAARRARDAARQEAEADQHAPGGCAHTAASPAYRPPPRLREFVIARDQTCRNPRCGQPAWRADLDHTRPHHRGGPTCKCNLGGTCRADHQLKQLPGWTLRQPEPGVFQWVTPAGRTYTTRPDPHHAS